MTRLSACLLLVLAMAAPAAADEFPVLFVETTDGRLIRVDNAKSFTVRDPGSRTLNVVPLDDGEEMTYSVPGVGLWAFELGPLDDQTVRDTYPPVMLMLLPRQQ